MICKVLGVSKVYQSKIDKEYLLIVKVSYERPDDEYFGEDTMSFFVSDSLKCFEMFSANPQSCIGKLISAKFVPGCSKLQDIEFI